MAQLFVPKSAGACDAINDTVLPPPVPGPPGGGGGGIRPPGGARSKLWIETIYKLPAGGNYYLGSNFDAIYDAGYASVRIPDLYADTDGNGFIDGGDTLYSLVDLSVYLTGIPTFNFNDHFTVVGGVVAGLPGMRFSTTDFAFDPVLGFTDPPYSGDAVVLSDHTLTPEVPEPTSVVLMSTGFAFGGLLRRRHRS
jgi:hypothetical protein